VQINAIVLTSIHKVHEVDPAAHGDYATVELLEDAGLDRLIGNGVSIVLAPRVFVGAAGHAVLRIGSCLLVGKDRVVDGAIVHGHASHDGLVVEAV